MTAVLKLGLIGDNIERSQSPRLHEICGQLAGIEVSYERLIPAKLDLSFDGVFAKAFGEGYSGINVTFPYKERVARLVTIPDPAVRAIGAVNTVLFAGPEPQGFNTDYSGFIQAYQRARPNVDPGVVCLMGAGGVGKAVAFALLTLHAAEIICVDLDRTKADALVAALKATGTRTKLRVCDSPIDAALAADGLINCTPLGMVNIGGTPLPPSGMKHSDWAFDAVYTPARTQFLSDAERAGLTVISGYELFISQGIDAWALFSGTPADPASLRAGLRGEDH